MKIAHNSLNTVAMLAATVMAATDVSAASDVSAVQSAGNGVAVGQSTLIATIDASDTFTTGLGGDYRATPYAAPWTVANTLELDGKRSLAWKMPPESRWGATSTKSDAKTQYPGETGAGSATGVTEGGQEEAAWGISYGERSEFVIQFDAVMPADRVAMIFGRAATQGAAGILSENTLSLFIRNEGNAQPSVGLFRSDTRQEVDTGLSSTLSDSGKNRWHNFAVRVDVKANTIEVFVDQLSIGVVDVGDLAPGFDWDASAVGYGLRSPGGDRLWSDNFQIGSPVSAK